MPTPANILASLERTDKWYLGGGRATLYAPAFPRSLDTPGFWDEVYFADIRLERLFCLLLLDAQGRPLNLRRALRRWTPDRLLTYYTVEGHSTLRIQEERVVTPNDTLACRITVTNSGTAPIRLHLLLWSLQSVNQQSVNQKPQDLSPDSYSTTVEAVQQDHDGLSFAHRVFYGQSGQSGEMPAEVHGWGERERATPLFYENADAPIPRVFVALGGSRLAESWSVNLSEGADLSPLWQTSVFPEKFRKGTLPRERQDRALGSPENGALSGQLHLAMHYVLEAEAGGSDLLTVGGSLALSRERAVGQLREDMAGDVAALSRSSWESYFASLPNFECDDVYLERYYWYRWYGLRLQTVDLADQVIAAGGGLTHPCVFEGIGAFRSQVSYSAQCHIRETAWMPDRGLACGSLLNFLDQQVRDDSARDGFLPGHLYLWRQDRGFYHANWGAVALHLFYLTGDREFVGRIYAPLARYAEYFERERDREQVHLYDVLDQGETGQEYSSRYLFVEPQADTWRSLQIKGVDATCYLFELQRTLATFAHALGKMRDSRWWDDKADATRDAVRHLMWDADAAFFKDVHPETLEPSPYKAAVGFYPFLSEIATRANITAWQHLADPQSFGTPYPVPTSSVDDPYYDPQAQWRGRRTSCPWNGRVWPMTNSHVTDALANAARTLEPRLKPMAVDLLERYVRMLFHEGDPKRPNSYEHYNPETGTPSLYRGIDDYQHSWIVDLILRHVVGILPAPGPKGALIIDPLPFALRRFRCDNLLLRGHRIDVIWNHDIGFTVRVDGKEALTLPERTRVEIPLNAV